MQAFPKVRNLVEISKISKKIRNLKFCRRGRSCSTSYLRGNQVDGSPLVAIRKQWLSRADLGPHKMINQCENLPSYRGFARWHGEKCLGFVVERISKINMDMIKARKGNEKHTFHEVPDFQKFRKNENFQENNENFRIFWIFQKRKTRQLGNGEALYESSVRKLGWRFTARLPW